MKKSKKKARSARICNKYIIMLLPAVFFVVLVVNIASCYTGAQSRSAEVSGMSETGEKEAGGNQNSQRTTPTAEKNNIALCKNPELQIAEGHSEQNEYPLEADGFVRTEAEAEIKIEEIKNWFPDGKYWNHMGFKEAQGSFFVTEIPCVHEALGYDYCNEYNGITAMFFPEYAYNIQCLAYASLVSDCIFGTEAPIYEIKGFENIRVGDHIRFVYEEHSAIVAEVGDDWLSLTEVNANYEDCLIEWDRVLTEEGYNDYGADGIMILSRY